MVEVTMLVKVDDVVASFKRGGDAYLFSVIVPVYNTEGYLAEAIESVICQTVGFENIQLILVDDGSTDSSARICEGYRERYPDNIVFIRKENGGVSSARNEGLSHVQGRWVNFLDSDDKWSLDAFEQALCFFKEHPDLGIVCCRHLFFGAKEGPHSLDYIYAKDRIIDITVDFDCPHLSFSNAFVARELMEGRHFDSELSVAEDFTLFNEMLLDEKRYGVSREGAYYYRRRNEGTSAMNLSGRDKGWWLNIPRFCYRRLFDLSLQKFGKVIPYIQYCIMYDLQARIQRSPMGILTTQECSTYRDMIVRLLKEIDDQIICSQRKLTITYIVYVLALKYDIPADEMYQQLKGEEGDLILDATGADGVGHQVRIRPIRQTSRKISIDFITCAQDGIEIEGCVNTFGAAAEDDVIVIFQCGDTEYVSEYLVRKDLAKRTAFDGWISPKRGFRVRIPFGQLANGSITAKLVTYGLERSARFAYGRFAGLNETLENSYSYAAGVILRAKESASKSRISFRRNVEGSQVAEYEQRLRDEIGQRPAAETILAYRRIGCEHRNSRRCRKVWLIGDRIERAGDNGEAFFTYLRRHHRFHVKPYFVISRGSVDYERLSRLGQVVTYGSDEHRQLFMQADAVFSSSADGEVLDPFGDLYPFVKDLCRHDFIYLRYGVMDDADPRKISRYRSNITRFITAAARERNAILAGAYHYSGEQVVLTGLPRHDRLLDKAKVKAPERTIFIAPTWREGLAGRKDVGTGQRQLNPCFRASEYCSFYNALITSPRLASLLERFDYRAQFIVHPEFERQTGDFMQVDRVEVCSCGDYSALLTASACMITDYSSLAFDFALLGKPIIYAQFDAATYLPAHTYGAGAFSYERDGFGPVCLDLDSALDALEETLGNKCVMAQGYRSRAEGFFYQPKGSRCRAVYKAALI